jgi:hypothetical protein
MQFAAEAVELVFERGEIDVELWIEAEGREIIGGGGGLNLAAMRTKKRGLVMRHGTGPTGNGNRGIDNLQHDELDLYTLW